MRYLPVLVLVLVLAFACACGGGGGGSGKPAEKPTTSTTTSASTGGSCATAYQEYETRWKVARTEELKEVDFDDDAIQEVVSIEVAILPKKTDVEKLRDQYGAVAAFIPDAPWPLALDAAEAAIAVCGEEAPRPS